MKTALITGISGRDGSYLAEALLEKDYRVVGILRRNSIVENQTSRIFHLKNIELEYGDLLDFSTLSSILLKYKPAEIYNLAAQSHVKISFDNPILTANINAVGNLNLLECIRQFLPESKFYQASSSEMFGNSIDEDGFQRLSTQMRPVSPYGNAKLFAFNSTKIYRSAYNLFACNGILFNHESPRRGSNFVTNKVIKTAVEIFRGSQKKLILGNIDSFRDWGHSYDYVRAMTLIMNYEKAQDWIVATGETRSIRNLCEYVFSKLNLDYKDYVIQDSKYFRPNELNFLKGDSADIRNELNWKPKYTFESLIDEMLENWLAIIKK